MEHEQVKRDKIPTRVTEADGSVMEVFPLPTDPADLEAILRDLFENHWQEITFGPIIQGAAWEMQAQAAPTHVGVLDGYITVAWVGFFALSWVGSIIGVVGNASATCSRPS